MNVIRKGEGIQQAPPFAKVLMRGGLGSARDPTAMLLGRSTAETILCQSQKMKKNFCLLPKVLLFSL